MIFITIRISKSLKIEHVTLLTLSRLISHIFSRNKSKLIKFSNLFAIRRRNVEITKKKKSENHTEDVRIKEFFEFFN